MDERTIADLSLGELLIGAAEAPPNYRIEFRNAIAAFGAEAAVALADWLEDASLGGFAARTIGKSAEVDRNAAVSVLKTALSLPLLPLIRADVVAELARLGVKPTPAQKKKGAAQVIDPVSGLSALKVGDVYKRRDHLHAAGLGGNVQKGISYPAGGGYALLFSDPSKVSEWGYNDRWDGTDAYWYFGEWSGPGDMTMTGGNRVICDRSPELYLFTAAQGGHRFAGRFAYDSHHSEMAERDGQSARALVFHLVRVGGVQ